MKNKITKTLMFLMLTMISVGAWAKVQTDEGTVFEFDSKTAIEAWGYTAPTGLNPGINLPDNVQFVKDNITVQANKGLNNETRFYYYNGNYELYIYKGGSIVITAPTDYNITSVSFVGTTVSFSCEGYDNETHIWTGEAASVTFNAPTSNSSIKVSRITVMIEEIVPTTATITLNPACNDGSKVYGTYSNTSAWVVPENLTVSAITVSSGILTMANYATGEVVPANTGVLVSASAGGNYTVYLSSEVGAPKTNALRPTGNGITAEAMATADAGKEYFRLTMHNGTECGFWWGAADGAAFALGANKAYLVADPASTSARGFSFSDNSEALESIEISRATTIYTLDGVKVNELRKGLNIVNGKKVMVMD